MEPRGKLIIDGDPVGKGRPRITREGRAFTPKKTRTYEQRVAWLAKGWWRQKPAPKGTPVIIYVDAFFSLPKSAKKESGVTWCTKGGHYPDLDNIIKAIKDSFNGLVYEDDCQVAGIVARRMNAPSGVRSRVIVRVKVPVQLPVEEEPADLQLALI